jgi:hypothetical protein
MMEVNADLCVAVPNDTGGEELPVELSSRVRNKHVGSKDVLHEIHSLVVKRDQVERESARARERESECERETERQRERAERGICALLFLLSDVLDVSRTRTYCGLRFRRSTLLRLLSCMELSRRWRITNRAIQQAAKACCMEC